MGCGVSKPVSKPVTELVSKPVTELVGDVVNHAFRDVIKQYGSFKEVSKALNADQIKEEALKAARKALNTPEGQASARKAIAERAAAKEQRRKGEAARNAVRFATAANMRF